METFTYSPTQLFEGRALGIVDGCEHVSFITNPVARKSQGANEVGKLIVDGMTIGGHIANGLGFSMTRASLLQLRQEIDNQSIIRGYYTPSELQQKAEIDRMINECREKSNKNFSFSRITGMC